MLPKQLKDSQRHQRQPKQVELFLQSWAPGRGAKGKGSKQKGKGKEEDIATKVEEKDANDNGVWMATIDLDKEVQESVEVSDEMWSTDEISTDYDVWAEHSPNISISVEGDIITNCSDFVERVTQYVVDSTRILGNNIVVKHSL